MATLAKVLLLSHLVEISHVYVILPVLVLGHCSSHFLWPFEVFNVYLHRYCSSFTVHCFMFCGGNRVENQYFSLVFWVMVDPKDYSISSCFILTGNIMWDQVYTHTHVYLKLVSEMKYCCHSGCGLSYLNLSRVYLGLACIFKLSNINMWGL